MEGKKLADSSSSSSFPRSSSSFSFTNELFGSKDSSMNSPPSGLFHSIFPPPSKAHGTKEYFRSEAIEKKHDPTTKPDGVDKEGKSQGQAKTDSFYQQERVQPCTLSSSIYYGGQDIYTNPQTTQSGSAYSAQQYNKDGGEDDGRASRGNWWQGSLYY